MVVDRPSDARRRILVAEDDPAVAGLVVDILESRGHQVWHAGNAAEARAMVDEIDPELILLDLALPDANGLLVCADLKRSCTAPVIICSATRRKEDPALGFELGADDFIAKPFSSSELLARVDVALRRGAERRAETDVPPPAILRIGDLVVDQTRCQVTVGEQAVRLTPSEFRLIAALASRPDEVVSRRALAESVWGYADAGVLRCLDVHVSRIRSKLQPAARPMLATVRGFGYQLRRRPDAVPS